MVNEWTRDDMPMPAVAVTAYMREKGRVEDTLSLPGVYAILDAVVEHLNAHHPKPTQGLLSGAADCVLESAERVKAAEYERDEARKQRDANAARAVAHAKGATRANLDRDEAFSRLTDMTNRAEAAERERDEAVKRAEAAEARTAPTVTRQDIEGVIDHWIKQGGNHEALLDDLWRWVSGDDPAVFVIRESDLPEVERDEDGYWRCESLAVNRHDTAEDLRGRTLAQLKHVAMREAVARAIEAEQATDPLLDKAQEFAELADWALTDREAGLLHTVAAHVLGQEATR